MKVFRRLTTLLPVTLILLGSVTVGMGATAPPAVSLQHPGNNRPAQEGSELGCGCNADIDSDGKADILLKDPRRRFGEVNMRPVLRDSATSCL